eukprot:413069_1
MFRPPKSKQPKYYRSAASIPVIKSKKKRVVPVCRRRYPKLPCIEDKSKILDSWQLLQLSNAKYPERVTQINGEGIGFTHIVNDDFKYFKNIEYIELSDNNIVLSDIILFPKLKHLSLNCNGIKTIPYLSTQRDQHPLFPKQLSHLQLAFNELSVASITNVCNVFHSLISLDLSNNSLITIPPQVIHLNNLRTFNLSNNKLQGIATWNILANIPALGDLDVSHNEFTMVPDIEDLQCVYNPQNMNMVFFAELQFLNLKSNLIQDADDILPIQHYNQMSTIDLCANAFLKDIWNSIKNRKDAAKTSLMERYQNVFIPVDHDQENQSSTLSELPRPCDFGDIYSQIVLARGIMCIVDDPLHQNIFELLPVLTASKQEEYTTNTSTSTSESNLADIDLDTNVFSLLQTQVFAHKPNRTVQDCIQQMNKLLHK